MKVKVMYFASLRDSASVSHEMIDTELETIDELFETLNNKYSFKVEKKHLRVAINEEYKSFDSKIVNNDTIVFIPPVAGG